MISRDTTPEAADIQLAIYRRMTPGRRAELASEMSQASRQLTSSGIRSRHASYGEDEVRFALFRLIHGDDLFRRAWPEAPLLEP